MAEILLTDLGDSSDSESVEKTRRIRVARNGTVQDAEIPSLDWAAVEEIQEYLERSVDGDPETPANRDAREKTLKKANTWATAAGQILFGPEPLSDAKATQLRVESANPLVRAWPWEWLSDDLAVVDTRVPVLRSIPGGRPAKVTPRSKRPLNVLLLVSRPGVRALQGPQDLDVGYQNIAELLTRYASDAVVITTLRAPCTWARAVVEIESGRYDIVHYDGHGDSNTLHFEHLDRREDRVESGPLAAALLKGGVQCFLSNSCASAQESRSRTASRPAMALELSRLGVPVVVGATAKFRADGARIFVTAFYEALLRDGDFWRACSAGRAAMRLSPLRIGNATVSTLNDSCVPVLLIAPGATRKLKLPAPPGLTTINSASLFIGRDSAMHELDLAVGARRVVLLHGLTGMGKTCLAQAYARTRPDLCAPNRPIPRLDVPRPGDPRSVVQVLKEVDGYPPSLYLLDNLNDLAGGWTEEGRSFIAQTIESMAAGMGNAVLLLVSRCPERPWIPDVVPRICLRGLSFNEHVELYNAIIERRYPGHGKGLTPADVATVKQFSERAYGHPAVLSAMINLLIEGDANAIWATIEGNGIPYFKDMLDQLDNVWAPLASANPGWELEERLGALCRLPKQKLTDGRAPEALEHPLYRTWRRRRGRVVHCPRTTPPPPDQEPRPPMDLKLSHMYDLAKVLEAADPDPKAVAAAINFPSGHVNYRWKPLEIWETFTLGCFKGKLAPGPVEALQALVDAALVEHPRHPGLLAWQARLANARLD